MKLLDAKLSIILFLLSPGVVFPSSSAVFTENYQTFLLLPLQLKFEVPVDWANEFYYWHDNMHITQPALDSVEYGDWEWDYEYSCIANLAVSFHYCAAHIGGDGWGKHGGTWGDLQFRVYTPSLQPATVESTVLAIARMRPDSAFNKSDSIFAPGIRSGYDTVFHVLQDTTSLWRRTMLSYSVLYMDVFGGYGDTAHVDFRIRQFRDSTIAFVFMYARNQDTLVDSILSSIVCPWSTVTEPGRYLRPKSLLRSQIHNPQRGFNILGRQLGAISDAMLSTKVSFDRNHHSVIIKTNPSVRK